MCQDEGQNDDVSYGNDLRSSVSQSDVPPALASALASPQVKSLKLGYSEINEERIDLVRPFFYILTTSHKVQLPLKTVMLWSRMGDVVSALRLDFYQNACAICSLQFAASTMTRKMQRSERTHS